MNSLLEQQIKHMSKQNNTKQKMEKKRTLTFTSHHTQN